MLTAMNAPQLLLSVGKKANHFYSVSQYDQDSNQHRVTLLWGGEPFVSYLEREQKEVRNTLAMGLVGAGMRQSDVCEVMHINRRQLSRYMHGQTSLSAGPGRPAIVTEEIEEFVRSRYQALCADGSRRWRERVAEEVAEKFHISLKPPTLSAMVQAVPKGRCQEPDGEKPEAGEGRGKGGRQESGEQTGQESLLSETEQQEGNGTKGGSGAKVPFMAAADPTEAGPEVQRAPTSIGPSTPRSDGELEGRLRRGLYSRYAAAMLLNPFIVRILEGVLSSERSFGSATEVSFESYLLSFLQMNTFGCNTYESAEGLHSEEFGPIVGLSRSPSLATLYRITPEFLSRIDTAQFNRSIARNYLHNLAVGSRLFYVDGHFQRYYGAERMLWDYHAQTHKMQKGYSQYALCSEDGSPFLLYDSDSLVNFQDAIEHLVGQLLGLTPGPIIPCIVFDRGGYDRQLWARFAGEQAGGEQFAAHYISWEQFDDTDYSRWQLDWQEMILELKGNDASHPRELALKVAEAPAEVQKGIWSTGSPVAHHRKLILRQDYEGRRRSICTPICTSDHNSAATDIVAQLCFRWRQENVFKLTDGDYGWDFISTYRNRPYGRKVLQELPPFLRETIEARMIDNPERRRQKAKIEKLRKELGRVAERLQKLREGKTLKTDQSRLRLPKDEWSLTELYQQRSAALDQLEAARLLLPAKVNRMGYLCENDYRRLDFSKKWVLDILRAAAHNVRRMALNTWMTVYPDWRDYTQRFRDLLQVGGVLQLKGRTLHVRLREMPQPRYQHAAEALVRKLQKLHPTTLGIGPYPMKFSFGKGDGSLS